MSFRFLSFLGALLCAHAAHAGTLITNQPVTAADGTARYFDVYVPSTVTPAPAVVLVLHGATFDAGTVLSPSDPASVWTAVSEQQGLIVVSPNGTNPLTRSGTSNSAYWDDCTGQTVAGKDTADDVGFIRTVVARVIHDYGADPTRIYATGMSNGAMMALRLGREAGDVFAAVEATSGLDPLSTQDQCHDLGIAVPMMLVEGDADPLVNYNGTCLLLGHCFSSFKQTVSNWLVRNEDAGATPVDEPVPASNVAGNGTSVDCQDFPGGGGIAVKACTVHNGGHTEPSIAISLGLSQLLYGKQNRDLETAQASWAFFATHQHP